MAITDDGVVYKAAHKGAAVLTIQNHEYNAITGRPPQGAIRRAYAFIGLANESRSCMT